MRRFVRAVQLLLLALPALGAAQPLRLCMDEQPHPPYILAGGGGTIPLLMQMAAQRIGLEVVIRQAPLNRCMEEVRLGLVHGYPSAAPADVHIQRFEFPRAEGKVDIGRATTPARIAVFRRKGADVDWDGQRFSKLAAPVLIATGNSVIAQRLQQVGAQVDDKAKTLEHNFSKLLAGRGDAVVTFENDGAKLLEQAPYAGRIEALPTPFMQQYYFLMLNRDHYNANRDAMEAMWTSIGKTRISAEYRAEAAKVR